MRRHDHAHRLRLRPPGDRHRRSPRAAHCPLGGALPCRLQLPRHPLRGAAVRRLRRDAGGDRGGLPELQGVHDRRPAAASEAALVPARLRTDRARDAGGGPARRPHDGSRGGRRAGADRLRALPRRGAPRRDEHAPGPHEALRAAGLRAGDRTRAGDGRRHLLRPHVRSGRARGRRGGAGGGRIPSTRRRSTSTPASTPSTTRRPAASAPTRTRRSSCRRTGRPSGAGWWRAASRPWRRTSTPPASR